MANRSHLAMDQQHVTILIDVYRSALLGADHYQYVETFNGNRMET